MFLSLRIFQVEKFKLSKSISKRENALKASHEEKFMILHMDNKEKEDASAGQEGFCTI